MNHSYNGMNRHNTIPEHNVYVQEVRITEKVFQLFYFCFLQPSEQNSTMTTTSPEEQPIDDRVRYEQSSRNKDSIYLQNTMKTLKENFALSQDRREFWKQQRQERETQLSMVIEEKEKLKKELLKIENQIKGVLQDVSILTR